MASGFGAVILGLSGGRDRTLAAGLVAERRAEDERFMPAELEDLFDSLRVPAPKSIGEYLRRLAADELVVKRKSGGWSLTDPGRERVDELIGEIDVAAVGAEQLSAGSSELDGVEHPLIAPEMAPLSFRPAIARILEVSSFERNVFCMTRFPDPDSAVDAPLRAAIEAAREQLATAGLTLHLANDRQAGDELFGNVVAHIWACKYGIAFLETLDPERGDQLNDNVLIEIGAMLVSGRRCCLLKDSEAPELPSDFIAQIYKPLEISDYNAVKGNVETWVRDDLGIS